MTRTAPRKRALVVGATGFLGRHISAALAAAAWEVVTQSRRPAAGPNSDSLPQPVALRAAVARALIDVQPSLVVNAVGVIWSRDQEAMVAANTEVPEQLALAMIDAGCSARLVHLGSCLEYAPVDPPHALEEDDPVDPPSFYGKTKLEGYRRIRKVADVHGLDLVALRVFNAIGARMSAASLLGRTVQSLVTARRDGRTAVIELVDRQQYRDYVDARDVAQAVLASATATGLGPGPTVLNIGSSTARSAEEVVRQLAAISAVDHRIRLVPPPDGPSRTAGASWQRAATNRAERLLGWSATTPLADTLRHIWASACPVAASTSVKQKASSHE